MGYLSNNELTKLSDAIINTVGYNPALRTVFLSSINRAFTNLLQVYAANEKIQLDLDLPILNDTLRLTDGSVPFQFWLTKAGQYVQPFPDANKIVQEALAKIENKSIKSIPITNIDSPTAATVNKIIEEKVVQQNDMLTFSFLEAGVKAGSGVARLRVVKYENNVPVQGAGGNVTFSGTGWLLTKELLITNHHVINARQDTEADASDADLKLQAANTSVDFDFNSDNMVPNTVYSKNLEAFNEELDFAIIRLKTPLDKVPSARFPQEILVAANSIPVNIIQHPFGHSKKVAIRNNHIFKTAYPKVFYFTDTEKGSSGSPVFDDSWKIIALHRASQLVEDVSYQGKSTGWVNEGIQLKAIFEWLKTEHALLYAEITTG
jgi:V8-like Glu-specific endopeptidase